MPLETDQVEWDDIEKTAKGVQTKRVEPDCAAVIRRWPSTNARVAYIHVRHALADEIENLMFGHPVRVQQSDDGTMLRIFRDEDGAWRWNGHRGKSHFRLQIGVLNSWPQETRAPVKCDYDFRPAGAELIVRVPSGWLRSAPARKSDTEPGVPERVGGVLFSWGQRVLLGELANHGSVSVKRFRGVTEIDSVGLRRMLVTINARLFRSGVLLSDKAVFITGGSIVMAPGERERLQEAVRLAQARA